MMTYLAFIMANVRRKVLMLTHLDFHFIYLPKPSFQLILEVQ